MVCVRGTRGLLDGNRNNNNRKAKVMDGKCYCEAVFVMCKNDDTGVWEPMCFFPTISWNGGNIKSCYCSAEGHNPCCEAFVMLDCRAPRQMEKSAVDGLREEMRGLGYVLTEIPAEEYYNKGDGRRRQMKKTVEEMMEVTDSDALLGIKRAN